jgi:hypothetical protein
VPVPEPSAASRADIVPSNYLVDVDENRRLSGAAYKKVKEQLSLAVVFLLPRKLSLPDKEREGPGALYARRLLSASPMLARQDSCRRLFAP